MDIFHRARSRVGPTARSSEGEWEGLGGYGRGQAAKDRRLAYREVHERLCSDRAADVDGYRLRRGKGQDGLNGIRCPMHARRAVAEDGATSEL